MDGCWVGGMEWCAGWMEWVGGALARMQTVHAAWSMCGDHLTDAGAVQLGALCPHLRASRKGYIVSCVRPRHMACAAGRHTRWGGEHGGEANAQPDACCCTTRCPAAAAAAANVGLRRKWRRRQQQQQQQQQPDQLGSLGGDGGPLHPAVGTAVKHTCGMRSSRETCSYLRCSSAAWPAQPWAGLPQGSWPDRGSGEAGGAGSAGLEGGGSARMHANMRACTNNARTSAPADNAAATGSRITRSQQS